MVFCNDKSLLVQSKTVLDLTDVQSNRLQNRFRFTPQQFPNRILIKGKCDETIMDMCRELGWDKEIESMMEKNKGIELAKEMNDKLNIEKYEEIKS